MAGGVRSDGGDEGEFRFTLAIHGDRGEGNCGEVGAGATALGAGGLGVLAQEGLRTTAERLHQEYPPAVGIFLCLRRACVPVPVPVPCRLRLSCACHASIGGVTSFAVAAS